MPKRRADGLRPVLLMPSLYGAASWGFWLVLYELRLIRWEPEPALATLVFVSVITAFCLSVITWHGRYREWYRAKDSVLPQVRAETPRTGRLYLSVLHGLGFIGLAFYVRDFAAALGGLTAFSNALVS